MTTPTLSPTAASAREAARSSDGKFGAQPLSEADLDLGPAEGTVPDFYSPELAGDVAINGNYSATDRKERVQVMMEDLDQAVANVVASGRLAEFMDSMRSDGFSRWSFNNKSLAAMQLMARQRDAGQEPDFSRKACMMMGKKQWEEQHNRTLKKGCKAIWILAPMTRKVTAEEISSGADPEDQRFIGFKAVPVFNVTDTEGDPIEDPEFGIPSTGEIAPGVLTGLRDRVAKFGFSYEEEEIKGTDVETGSGKLGYTKADGSKRLVVDSRLKGAGKASVLAHELGHVACGHIERIAEYQEHRGEMETEAQMTAYLVGRELGIENPDADGTTADSFSADYIASWSKGDPKVIRGALTKSMKAYQEIMAGDWPTEDTETVERTPAKTPEPAAV